jgi:uncharacterized membrane protein YcaP (DUF421 family)
MPESLARFLDWLNQSMLKTDTNVFELIVRGIVVYFFLLIILRLTGKRQFGQLAPFDLVLLLVLSNAVQNSMNAGDNSLTAGLISAVTLIACNSLMAYLTAKSKRFERLIEGRPVILVHNGTVDHAAMAKEEISQHELMTALRGGGLASVSEVHYAVLETSGRISIVPYHEGKTPAAESLPVS